MKRTNLSKIQGPICLGAMLIVLSGCDKTDATLGGGALGTAAGAGIGYAIDGGAGGAVLGGVLGGLTGAAIGHHVGEDENAAAKQQPSAEAYYRQQKIQDEAEARHRKETEMRNLEQEVQRERLELERERIRHEREQLNKKN